MEVSIAAKEIANNFVGKYPDSSNKPSWDEISMDRTELHSAL